MNRILVVATVVLVAGLPSPVPAQDTAPKKVDAHNFVRAETDTYFASFAKEGGLGKLSHTRQLAPIEHQSIVRMNRDTLYSHGVFDLDAGPVTITLPDTGKRFMSLLAINQDHYAMEVAYAPVRKTFDRKSVGTRYLALLIRTLVDAEDPNDVAQANRLQDKIAVDQAATGSLDLPQWDKASQDKARDALKALGSLGELGKPFGTKDEVDPIDHLLGTAGGWGGNPSSAAEYSSVVPERNDGKTPYVLDVKDVPVDGFWSISVYNAQGFFEKNARNAYSLNNITAKPNADGSFTVRFGDCDKQPDNCLPIMPGWNYAVRMYRPRAAILDGSWTFPAAKPAG